MTFVWTSAGIVAALVLVLVAVNLLLDLVSRVARYRRYRNLWPRADRGRVWRHVR